MKCEHLSSRVIDSRPAPKGSVRRRRVCRGCGHRWTTYEVDEEIARSLDDTREALQTLMSKVESLCVIANVNGHANAVDDDELAQRIQDAHDKRVETETSDERPV